MSWDNSLSGFFDLLVRCYPDPTSARDVVEKAGLSTGLITFGDNIDNVWMSILGEAWKCIDGLLKIACVAQKDYPNVDFPSILRQIDEGAVRGPKLAEHAWKGAPRIDERLEKLIGDQPTSLPLSFLEAGLEKARPVARVVCPRGVATGFLMRRNLLITNHHVIASAEEAKQATVQFIHQETPDGLATQIEEFELAPEDGFATSPLEGGDDWTAVRLAIGKGDARRVGDFTGATYSGTVVAMNGITGLCIIQHPGGLPKHISLYHNLAVFVGCDRLQYLTDTPVSSGAPVFDSRWRLVALHHSGGSLTEPVSKGKRLYFRNEGIHINAIIKGLAERGL
jgi:hypothetical protein